MTKYKIGVLEGDGIGHEVVNETLKALRELEKNITGISFKFEYLPVGLKAYYNHGSTLPEKSLEALKKCDAAILGPLTTHEYNKDDPNFFNVSGFLRKELDLFANIRPAKSFKGVDSKYNNIDLVVIRENTEGMYADRNMYYGSGEIMPDPDTVISFRVVTRKASERIAKIGYDLAQKRRRKLTLVHKKNVLDKGCGMFYDSSKKVSESYSNVTTNDFHIDAFCHYLVHTPEDLDVIVTTNMFGDIISDLTAGMIGGLGLAPGLNLGDNFMIAQATHGSAPDIANENIANPIAKILSAQLMLTWLGIRNNDDSLILGSSVLYESVINTIESGILTPDLGGNHTTKEVGDAIANQISLSNQKI